MKKIIFQGPNRNNVGIKPLYNAQNPSFLNVCIKQSIVPEYICIAILPSDNLIFLWFINLV